MLSTSLFVKELLVWFLPRVDSHVLAQVARCREELVAAWLWAVECRPLVHPLVCFQSVEGGERLGAAGNITAVRPIFSVHSYMDLQTVRIQEGFAARLFRTLEGVLA